MSGIEVAGLVLGVLPVVIQALRGYRTILSSIRNVESDIQALILGLQTEGVRLRTSSELLLEGIVPADDIDALLDHPFSEKWEALGVANKLKIRLYDTIPTYQKMVDDMKTVEAELKRSLGFMLQEDGEVRRSHIHYLYSSQTKSQLTHTGASQAQVQRKDIVVERMEEQIRVYLEKEGLRSYNISPTVRKHLP